MSSCDGNNEYNGELGVRISSVFVILIGSFFGAVFPIWARRHRSAGVPEWVFFVSKYFGSGVIIATAFIHLLAPANEALGDSCLTGVITEYPWVEGIALMTVFSMFILELMTMRYAKFGEDEEFAPADEQRSSLPTNELNPRASLPLNTLKASGDASADRKRASYAPGEDHLGHSRDHVDNNEVIHDWETHDTRGIIPESYSAQLTAIFILEFGVIFHSIFIGLTLAVAGEEFHILYVVLVFHQTFEGLGLGSRLASVPWPKTKKWTPYILGAAYGLTTPIAISIGLGLRKTYAPGSTTALLVNGVFDSISAGILLYTGLVELMAHEFMFSPEMSRAPIKVVLSAFFMMCLGAGLMALLGKWA